ncbi:hypothetical protein [uncultured Clostridium sp.]|nr:hypothetical protein [uncultured Clostridium sp.]
MLRIAVSFKKTTRDVKLFTYLNSLEEKSDFIKRATEHYINHLKNNDMEG